MERDSAVRLNITLKILDSNEFIESTKAEPYIRDLMLNKFKEFLNDDYFTDIERQIVLIKFLQCGYDLSIINKVLQYINSECELKDDYECIILEWTLGSSNKIKQETLYPVDGVELSYSFEEFIQIKCERLLKNQLLTTMQQHNFKRISDKNGKKED